MTPFPISNLPYGAFSTGDARPALGIAFEESILDLGECARRRFVEDADGALREATLNRFLAQGPDA